MGRHKPTTKLDGSFSRLNFFCLLLFLIVSTLGAYFGLPKPIPDHPHLIIRPLKSDDFDKSWCQLLSELTPTIHSHTQFKDRFESLQQTAIQPKMMKLIIVVEDCWSSKLIGSASLLVEPKFNRGASCCISMQVYLF